ncbi:MAG: hypothetical protein CMJ18_23285 [Phycisphaeraceae bacterium]|nr:hypothetical protein [Phycisphaeraceae bacterium]
MDGPHAHTEDPRDVARGSNPLARKELRNLARFLSAWCDAVGIHPVDLAERAERIKARWVEQNAVSKAEIKRFGSSRPHFSRLLKGQIHVEYGDRQMLQYLSEIFEIDVVQLFDTLADRVWPTIHLAPTDYIEAPLQDPQARGARYFFPLEQLAGCPMHHLYLELEPGGSSGLHRHFAGTEMMRLDEGEAVTLKFPTRARNRREIVLRRGEITFFDATLQHQVINTSDVGARLLISRNYDFDQALESGTGDGPDPGED